MKNTDLEFIDRSGLPLVIKAELRQLARNACMQNTYITHLFTQDGFLFLGYIGESISFEILDSKGSVSNSIPYSDLEDEDDVLISVMDIVRRLKKKALVVADPNREEFKEEA